MRKLLKVRGANNYNYIVVGRYIEHEDYNYGVLDTLDFFSYDENEIYINADGDDFLIEGWYYEVFDGDSLGYVRLEDDDIVEYISDIPND